MIAEAAGAAAGRSASRFAFFKLDSMIDSERFGGRRAYMNHLAARGLLLLGAYGGLLNVEWRGIERLVFVCKGNICRSPYAEARARSLGLEAVSFGLQAADGAPADGSAMRNAQQRQINLATHRSTRIDAAKLLPKDLILFFEPQQVAQFRARHPGAAAVTLAGLWAEPKRPYVCDPSGRSDACFQECFSVIDASVTAVAARLAPRGRSGTAVA
jgi:protein-tyrosine phosphatase